MLFTRRGTGGEGGGDVFGRKMGGRGRVKSEGNRGVGKEKASKIKKEKEAEERRKKVTRK